MSYLRHLKETCGPHPSLDPAQSSFVTEPLGISAEAGVSELIVRADRLDSSLFQSIGGETYSPFDSSDRITTGVAAASLAWEHSRALRVLLRSGMPSAAFALLRLQHEAVTRSILIIYAASQADIAKLSAPLSKESEAAAGRIPMMAKMLEPLESEPKAALALAGLRLFKLNNSTALNSFVHGGIHALKRHAEGFPVSMIESVVRNSNGLLIMAAMSLAQLAGDAEAGRRVAEHQSAFATDVPAILRS